MKTRHHTQALCILSLCAAISWSFVGSSAAGGAPMRAPVPHAHGLQSQFGRRARGRRRLSTADRRLLGHGYLGQNETTHRQAKTAAKSRAAARRAPSSPALDGSPLRSWQGLDATIAAADAASAIGTSRFIETANGRVAFYNRTSDTPLSTAGLRALAADFTVSSGNYQNAQVIWDPTTRRFYYVMQNASNVDFRLELGFSTTADPTSVDDFCHYHASTGINESYADLTLGDTSNLWLIGANVYAATGYTRSDVIGVTKPPSGSSCPTADTFGFTDKANLIHADGTSAYAPVTVNQTDTNATGWVVSAGSPGTGTANFISVFQVTRSGTSMVIGAAKKMTVASFSVPADAAQKGSTRKIDTLDGRLTNAVSAVDPSRGSGKVAIWTQHTVLGGPGAEVRWYEIDPSPATPVPFQNGTAGSSALFAFNGAISPDRRVNGTSTAFGSSMVLTFDTSSSSQFVNVAAVSRRGGHGQSGLEVIKAGTVALGTGACSAICASGRHAGASPDPASDTTQSDGVVWLTNQTPGSSTWGTWNFAGRPSPAPK